MALLREARGISQEILAKRSGVPRATISRIERGGKNVPAEAVVRLARCLDVTAGYLLGDPDAPTTADPQLQEIIGIYERSTEADRKSLLLHASRLHARRRAKQ